jgi:hypothetical protein
MPTLYELTKILRTKQAGPFEMAMDLIFLDKESYNRTKASGVITKELIASLYQMDVEDVRVIRWFDAGNALKITVPRWHPSGSPGETDLYADQQHVLLEDIEIPHEIDEEELEKIRRAAKKQEGTS